MPWWPWPSTKTEDDVGIKPFIGATETKSFKLQSQGGYEEKTEVKSLFDRIYNEHKIVQSRDVRSDEFDVNNIDNLTNRYQEEFAEANRVMNERSKNAPRVELYDYDKDRRYQQWKSDQKEMRERLKVHWFDELIDSPFLCLIYFLRVSTTAGLFYGLGRTFHLYRAMDKVYARLNGVTLAGLAFGETTSAIAKGTAVAAAATVGLVCGDVSTNLLYVTLSGDVSVPNRCWYNVTASCAFSGLFAGATMAALQYKELTPWGIGAFTLGGMGASVVLGVYLGYTVYRPFAATREHNVGDPYWRPWYMRRRGEGGSSVNRGRYV